MPRLVVLDPNELDFEKARELQVQAFAELMKSNGVADQNANLQTIEYYKWKYITPYGHGLIAQVQENEEVLSMKAMFPLLLSHSRGTTRIWQAADAATALKARGKGFFMDCVQTLRKKTQPDDISIAFPNRNSLTGFKKAGWKDYGHLTTFLRFVPNVSKSSFAFKKIDLFDERQDRFFNSLSLHHLPTLSRTSQYMNWRYRQRPHVEYFCYALTTEEGGYEGVVVMREINISGRKAMLVMELVGVDSKAERKLMTLAARISDEKKLKLILMVNNTVKKTNAASCLFFPIPVFLLPKRQVFVAIGDSQKAQELLNQKWRLHIGDWDGF